MRIILCRLPSILLPGKNVTGEKIDQIVILTVTEDGTLDVHKDDPSLYVKKLEEMIEEYKTGKIGDQ